jgi:two-component system response regulator DevR
MATRVFLLDDHEVVRGGLRALLAPEPDLEVVGEAATAAAALELVPRLRPDVAVLDVHLPDGDGIAVCRELRSLVPEVACLVLTAFADDDALVGAVVAGAAGFVLKEIRGPALVDAIRKAASGQSLLDPAEVARVRRRLARELDEPLRRLTPRERRILELIAEGRTNRQIADALFLAEKTVKNYVSNLLVKLGMATRTEAAVYMARRAARRSTLPSS